MANWIQRYARHAEIASMLNSIERQFHLQDLYIVPNQAGYNFVIVAKVEKQLGPITIGDESSMIEVLIGDALAR